MHAPAYARIVLDRIWERLLHGCEERFRLLLSDPLVFGEGGFPDVDLCTHFRRFLHSLLRNLVSISDLLLEAVEDLCLAGDTGAETPDAVRDGMGFDGLRAVALELELERSDLRAGSILGPGMNNLQSRVTKAVASTALSLSEVGADLPHRRRYRMSRRVECARWPLHRYCCRHSIPRCWQEGLRALRVVLRCTCREDSEEWMRACYQWGRRT